MKVTSHHPRVRYLQELLGIRVPLLLSPMANAAGSALGAAVTIHGGLGSIPCASLTPAQLRTEVSKYRDATPDSTILNLNFFTHTPLSDPKVLNEQSTKWMSALGPYYKQWGVDPAATTPSTSRSPFDDTSLQLLYELRPSTVSFHFGLPSGDGALSAIREACPGVVILSTATSAAEAVYLRDAGADVIICQGLRAGGHQGHFLDTHLKSVKRMNSSPPVGTDVLVKEVFDVIGDTIPLIAAGGISTPTDVELMLSCGASGVQVGTAFLLCPEATPNQHLHANLSHYHASQRGGNGEGMVVPTVFTRAFTGGIARGFPTQFTTDVEANADDCVPTFPTASLLLAPLRAKAEMDGNNLFTSMFAGCPSSSMPMGLTAADVMDSVLGA